MINAINNVNFKAVYTPKSTSFSVSQQKVYDDIKKINIMAKWRETRSVTAFTFTPPPFCRKPALREGFRPMMIFKALDMIGFCRIFSVPDLTFRHDSRFFSFLHTFFFLVKKSGFPYGRHEQSELVRGARAQRMTAKAK